MGIPNAAAQRQDIIDLLKKSNTTLNEIKTTLNSGKVTVRLAAPPEEGEKSQD